MKIKDLVVGKQYKVKVPFKMEAECIEGVSVAGKTVCAEFNITYYQGLRGAPGRRKYIFTNQAIPNAYGNVQFSFDPKSLELKELEFEEI